MIVNISDAITQLSKLVDMVYHGETVVIAKNNLPLVDLVPHKPQHTRYMSAQYQSQKYVSKHQLVNSPCILTLSQ